MKLSYTVPHIHVNVKDVKLPTQDTTSDIEVNIGSANVHIEGDVGELVTYMKETVAVVKDVTAWAIKVVPSMIEGTDDLKASVNETAVSDDTLKEGEHFSYGDNN